jgi:uncharacterized membrane protein (UPF0127 family)
MPLPRRLRRLPLVHLPLSHLSGDVRCAHDPLARLLGLVGLSTLPADAGLLLPRTRSIHTFGMRFALDLLWLDRDGRVVRIDHDVRPWRVRACRGARSVVELRSTLDP